MAFSPFSLYTRMSIGTAAAFMVAGCAAGCGERPPDTDRAAQHLPLGSPSLAPPVRGLNLLVVGDSWARNLGIGVADADRNRRNVVINAGEGGCGLMQPAQIRARGKLLAAPPACNTWPQRWRDLVAKYHPSAVLLEVGYWDGQDSQRLPGEEGVSSIVEPVFRERFDAQIDRAVHILSTGGARVYVPTVIDNEGAARENSDAMNVALRAAPSRNSQARLLDLHDQLCSSEKVCPAEINGIRVYDETGHPSVPARDRLGAWILNSIYTDLHGRNSLRTNNQ